MIITFKIRLVYIYIDESGDLGFGESSSRYFILCYVIVNCHHIVIKKVKRLLNDINTHSNSHIHEFKFGSDRNYIRHKFLNLISKLDVDIGVITIKKSAIKLELRSNKANLYNYFVIEYLPNTILSYCDNINHVELHLDLSMSKSNQEHFNKHFCYKLEDIAKVLQINISITKKIFHDYSHNEPCIQIADYIAGSMRQLYELDESRYYEMIKNRILYTHEWGINK